MTLFLSAVLATLLLVGGRGTPLDDYVNKPDPSYKYDVLHSERGTNYTTYYLNMTSQTWKPRLQSQPVWWHEMTIFIPDKIDMDSALLLINGGLNDKSSPSSNDKISDLMRWIAISTNTVTAILKQVPNQPISFNNDPSRQKRKEDDIIAWTWRTFIKDNGSDPEILLRMPMTKAAVRGLDTVQDLVLKVANFTVNRFMVTGASKRGWATWTTAAVDKRVVAFVPVVMDLLNLVKILKSRKENPKKLTKLSPRPHPRHLVGKRTAQEDAIKDIISDSQNLHHYYRSLGGWTYAFLSYYLVDFTSMIDRPATKMIEDLVDPISYMERYRHKPKLIVSAGGDEFFMIDDAKFYYDKLVGEKYLRMVPNADHKLKDQINSVFHEIQAFYQSVMHRKSLPVLTWKLEHTPRGGRITLKTDMVPQSVQVYHATTLSSKRKDFRMYVLTPEHPFHPTYNPVIWFSTNATQLHETSFVAEFDNPKKGWTAFFIEVTYPGLKDSTLKFTTETLITPNTYPFPDCHAEACRGHLV